jgi:hypothetical protein
MVRPRRSLRRLSRVLCVALPSMVVAMGLTAAPASAATCGPAVGFTRLESGGLYGLHDEQVLTGANTLNDSGALGKGWGGFAWTGAGGDGVLYALTSAGALRWFRWDVNARAWAAGSGRTVGSGFNPGTKVTNIAVGANGWFYVVRADGRLVVYQHTGLHTGAATWANRGGWVIGSGWTKDEIIAPQGDGVVYRQRAGNLYWLKHSDPTAGAVTWANGGRPVRIGTGWRFYDVIPLGGGVLLTTTAPSGQVTLFQHVDPAGGGAGWAAPALKKYLARSDSFGVSVAPDTCS